MSGYGGLALALAGYAGGLSLAIGFIIGFSARQRTDAGGKIVGKVKQMDPIQNTSREALIEQERDRINLEDYET